MKALRHWSVRHADLLGRLYTGAKGLTPRFGAALRVIGGTHAGPLVKTVERAAKGFFFDCQMCGQCVLSDTGMACPTNCPKTMRNGPCGGVTASGNCEVKPTMRCVWVEATEGRKLIARGLPAQVKALPPIDQRLKNSSMWMGLIAGQRQATTNVPGNRTMASQGANGAISLRPSVASTQTQRIVGL